MRVNGPGRSRRLLLTSTPLADVQLPGEGPSEIMSAVRESILSAGTQLEVAIEHLRKHGSGARSEEHRDCMLRIGDDLDMLTCQLDALRELAGGAVPAEGGMDRTDSILEILAVRV